MESEPFGANPGVTGVVVAVVENFAAQLLICIVTGFLALALELGLRQQQSEPIGLLLLLLFLLLLQPVGLKPPVTICNQLNLDKLTFSPALRYCCCVCAGLTSGLAYPLGVTVA